MYKLTEQDWMAVVRATRGNQTLLGCVMLSVLGRPAKSPPMCGPHGWITTEGIVMTSFTSRSQHIPEMALGTVAQFLDEIKRICDASKFSDDQALALAAAVRKWIFTDDRALIIGMKPDALTSRH